MRLVTRKLRFKFSFLGHYFAIVFGAKKIGKNTRKCCRVIQRAPQLRVL